METWKKRKIKDLDYKESSIIFLDFLKGKISHRYKKFTINWERGIVSIIDKYIREGIPLKEIEEYIRTIVTNNYIFGKYLPRPKRIFSSFKPKGFKLILVDENRKERDKNIWGYFDNTDTYIKPSNQFINNIIIEYEKRILTGEKDRNFNNYFRDDGFLKDEYSFIVGIFNEKNTKRIKI